MFKQYYLKQRIIRYKLIEIVLKREHKIIIIIPVYVGTLPENYILRYVYIFGLIGFFFGNQY